MPVDAVFVKKGAETVIAAEVSDKRPAGNFSLQFSYKRGKNPTPLADKREEILYFDKLILLARVTSHDTSAAAPKVPAKREQTVWRQYSSHERFSQILTRFATRATCVADANFVRATRNKVAVITRIKASNQCSK